MPRAITIGAKLLTVSALAIAITFGRAEFATAYYPSDGPGQVANNEGKDKVEKARGDEDRGRGEGNARADAKAEARSDARAEAPASAAVSEAKAADRAVANATNKNEAKAAEKSDGNGAHVASNTSAGNQQSRNSSGPPGNNGTVKIHEGASETSPVRHNDPHVCTFHIHGFNFDDASTGTWEIRSWPPTGDRTTAAEGTWGAADTNGDWREPKAAAMTLEDGHYKLYAEQMVPGTPGGQKHKVFWVRCGSQTSGSGSSRGELRSEINSAERVGERLDTRIEIAERLLVSGGLSAEQVQAIRTALDLAATADTTLTNRITEAGNALDRLEAALRSGVASEIAAAVSAAETAMINLEAAVQAAANANVNLAAAIEGSFSISTSTTQVATSTERAELETAQATQTERVDVADLITTTSNQAVAGVQTAPAINATLAAHLAGAAQAAQAALAAAEAARAAMAAQAAQAAQAAAQQQAQAAQAAGQQQSQAVAGVSNLPSTSSADSSWFLLGFGGALIGLGTFLARWPNKFFKR